MWGFLSIPASSNEDMAWIQDEGYMDCIWKLAEKSARQTATENLRVDIFMQRGSPQGCKVNENSLSSGLLYWGHESCEAYFPVVSVVLCVRCIDIQEPGLQGRPH